MNFKVSKLLIFFISFCIGTTLNCFADTNLGNGVSYSGKVKKGRLTGNGSLTIRDYYNQVVLVLSGDFATADNGRTQVNGQLYFSDSNKPAFQNAIFELDSEKLDSICIKKGAKINTESVEVLRPDGSKTSMVSLIGYTADDEYIILSPEERTPEKPTAYTTISFETTLSGKKYSGYGIRGILYYLLEKIDDSHASFFEKKGGEYAVKENRNGNDWVSFDNDQCLIKKFSKTNGSKCLIGEFSGIVKDSSGNPRFVKYIGSYTDGDVVYKGEFQLPYQDIEFSRVKDNMNAYNRINVTKQPEFLSSTRERVNGVKIHKKMRLNEGGTILSHIKPDELNSVDSLTVVGILYSSDMKIIGEMANLEYLDLSNTFITYSPKEKEERRENRMFQEAFLEMMSGANESKRKSNEITQTQYENNKMFLDLLNDSKEIEPKSDPCFVPSINNLPALQTLILPTYARRISRDAFKNCPNLETVILPEYLESINEGCFQNCVRLKNITFPETLKYVYFQEHDKLPFFGCSSLREIDFGNCTFNDPDNWYRFPECRSLAKFVFPKNTRDANFSITNSLTVDIYFPATIKEQNVNIQNSAPGKANLHFKSKTPPENTPTPRLCPIIYIPKGSLTEYYSAYGKDFKYIEE